MIGRLDGKVAIVTVVSRGN